MQSVRFYNCNEKIILIMFPGPDRDTACGFLMYPGYYGIYMACLPRVHLVRLPIGNLTAFFILPWKSLHRNTVSTALSFLLCFFLLLFLYSLSGMYSNAALSHILTPVSAFSRFSITLHW